MVRNEAPLVVFLVETKADISFMKTVQAKLEYTQGVIVPSDGRSGGLAMLWKEGSHVEVHKYSHSHIDVIISDIETNLQWKATNFYGHPNAQQKHISWKLLERLNTQLSLPWIVFGDFNEITHLDEKCGGAERSADQMQAFRNALDASNLLDLGFTDLSFTWCNGRFGKQRTLVRLDRMVANSNWKSLFPGARVQHRSMSASDHCFLILHSFHAPKNRRKKPRFCFETVWLREAECKYLVELACSMPHISNGVPTTQDRIKSCQQQLQWWNKNVFERVDKQLKEKQDKLQYLKSLDMLHEFAEDIHLLRKEINDLLDKENDIWWQRS